MNDPKKNFDPTACRLIRDVSLGLGRDYKDPVWVGTFCVPMVGNLGHECGGFALMEEGKPTVKGSLGGISFAQWTGMNAAKGGRRALFMAHCRSKRLHPYSYDAAVSFIIHELTTNAASVVNATVKAARVDPAANGLPANSDGALLGRVIRFEKLYENAGVKRYPARYSYAIKAARAYETWARAGFPEPAPYVMPKARFNKEFDAEFGLGVSTTTVRWDGRTSGTATTLPPEVIAALGGAPAGNERTLTRAEWKTIQLRLRELGFTDVGVADGRPGEQTRAALKLFQTMAGLKSDGLYGPATRAALDAGTVKKPPPEIRQDTTAHELRVAGEPVMVAAKPVSTVSQATAAISGVAAFAGAIASLWPQASSALDGLKASVGDVPGWVWPLCTATLAIWFYYQNKRVQAAQVESFKAGAVNTVALLPSEIPAALPSAECHTPGAVGLLGSGDGYAFSQPFHVDHDSLDSDEDRPLGSNDEEDDEMVIPAFLKRDGAGQ